MLQAAFGPSCMNWASVFEWHKKFKEGRESVRDDERCGRSKAVNTPELIGQIKNFMDKDRRVYIETISAQFDVSVGTVHAIIGEILKMRKICAKFVPRVSREDQKERRCHDSREMVEQINSDPAVLDALVTCNESWIYCPETKRQSSQWKHAGSPRPKKTRRSKSNHKLLMIPFLTALAWSTCTGFPLDREFRKRFRRKRLALFKSGQWHFHQDNAPVYNSILVIDYLSKMGIKTVPQPPNRPDLARLLVIPQAQRLSLWDNWGDERGCDEVVGTVQGHCSRRRLLRRGLEFHVCTINKSAHTKKVWKPIEGTSYIYIYIYIYDKNQWKDG